MVILTWEYMNVVNPQKVECSTMKEARKIRHTVQRFAKELIPTNFVFEIKEIKK